MIDPMLLGLMYQAITVKKAQTPEPVIEEDVIVSKAITVQKAWEDPTGRVHVEGWISTPDEDIERDSVIPEAFAPSINDYFAAGAPLTTEHQMLPTGRNLTRYPVGHVQKAALVRDGQVFASAAHPTDPADFEYFPNTGTGVWGRAVIDDPLAGSQVMKGNVRGFSWVGKVTEYTPLPGGRRQFDKVGFWRETTIAAFPVNTKAVVVAAKQGV